jgi:hypothetical protein
MGGSVPQSERFIEVEREIKAVGEKRARLLKKNAIEIEAATSQRDMSVDLKA